MYPGVEFMKRETFLIKVIRPRGEDSQSRNRYAHIAFICTQSHLDTHTTAGTSQSKHIASSTTLTNTFLHTNAHTMQLNPALIQNNVLIYIYMYNIFHIIA